MTAKKERRKFTAEFKHEAACLVINQGYSHACEGYDPESKGKVEDGVKYVKGNALYGEVFNDWSSLGSYMANWLNTVANQRVHATTGEIPQAYYDELEREQMKLYLSPVSVHLNGQMLTRKADKTGLILFKANKYSVPMVYQRGNVFC